MEKKRKASVTFSAIALALVVSMAAGLFMQRSGLTPAYLVFATGSNPDSYGNKIHQVFIQQNKTGSYETVALITEADYTSSMTVEIDADYPTYLKVEVCLNNTLAGSAGDATDQTRVYLNVSGEFTNQLLTATGEVEGGGGYYWQVMYNCTVWTPATDTTYDCAVRYEAYY